MNVYVCSPGWGANSRPFTPDIAMVQVGRRVSTLLAVRNGLFCEFLAWFQEIFLHGSWRGGRGRGEEWREIFPSNFPSSPKRNFLERTLTALLNVALVHIFLCNEAELN